MRFTPEAWNWDVARRRCLREARRHARSESDAQDAVQAAMLAAWRARDNCQTPHDPLPWMLAITRREAWRTRPEGVEVQLDEWADGERATLDEVERIAERLDLRAAIAELDGAERELLRLRYVEDLAQPAVAQRLGIPEGTAKVKLHRVRSHLRAVLTPA